MLKKLVSFTLLSVITSLALADEMSVKKAVEAAYYQIFLFVYLKIRGGINWRISKPIIPFLEKTKVVTFIQIIANRLATMSIAK